MSDQITDKEISLQILLKFMERTNQNIGYKKKESKAFKIDIVPDDIVDAYKTFYKGVKEADKT